MTDLAPGTIFANDFRVLREIARGGMGVVYEVEQVSAAQVRALKVMLPQVAADTRTRERFVQEARIGARIASDHVVKVVAAGVDPTTGALWLAMEFLKGQDLATVLDNDGFLSLARVRVIFEQIGRAMAAAHQAGVVHRDLKPENIFLARSDVIGAPFVVKVLDFGIAKFLQDSSTKLTQGVGTPFWMAPEQIDDHGRVTFGTDVWALGLIAFSLLTGRCYWKSLQAPENTIARFYREISVDPIVPASVRAREIECPIALPEGFDAWFARCVARDPAERFTDAGQCLAAALPVLTQAETSRVPTVGAADPRAPAQAPFQPPVQSLPGARYAAPDAPTWVSPSSGPTQVNVGAPMIAPPAPPVAPWPPPSAPPAWAPPAAPPSQTPARGPLWLVLLAAGVALGGGGLCVKLLVRTSAVAVAPARESPPQGPLPPPAVPPPGVVLQPPVPPTPPMTPQLVALVRVELLDRMTPDPALSAELSGNLQQHGSRVNECYADARRRTPNVPRVFAVTVRRQPLQRAPVVSVDPHHAVLETCLIEKFGTFVWRQQFVSAAPFVARYAFTEH